MRSPGFEPVQTRLSSQINADTVANGALVLASKLVKAKGPRSLNRPVVD